MKEIYKLIFIMLIIGITSLSIIYPSYAQEKNIYSTESFKSLYVNSYIELKIIETDHILKLAKEQVPFDRVFYLKIKRNSVGKKADIGNTITDITETTYPLELDSVNILRKKIEEIKEIIPSIKQEKEPSRIISAKLMDIYKNNEVKIDADKFIQEKKDSEFIFIEFNKLIPNRDYSLEIIWNDNIEPDIYYFNTVSSTLDKRLRQIIFSQLGVAVPFFKNDDVTFSTPSLMLGVYYNVRPIDPDIPIKYYQLYALQRFSYMMGVTINSIAVKDLRRDLIGNSNILLGIGYQPFEAVRISGGYMLFYELDPNRLYSDRKSIAKTFYLSATIDIKLKDIIGGVITTLGFK